MPSTDPDPPALRQGSAPLMNGNLDQTDFRSQTWRRIERRLQQRLDTLRAVNDQALDPIKTATLRGRIAMLKEMQRWPSGRPDDTADPAALMDP